MGAASTVLIVNPQSRGGWPMRKWPTLEPMLRSALGGSISVRFTRGSGDGRTQCREALAAGAQLVIAMGGDGTASEVAGGYLAHHEASAATEPSASFAYLPCATGGDLRRTLETPESLQEAAAAIARSPGRLIDAGRIEYTDHDGRTQRSYFINVASAGVGGLVCYLANTSSKALGGTATFLLASLRGTLRYRNAKVRVRLDDRPEEEHRIYSFVVANGRFFGGGMEVAPKAVMDDGAFDVVTIGDLSFLEASRLGTKIYSGNHLSLPKVACTQARTVRAAPVDPDDKVLIEIDGETPGRLPATWTILPKAVHYRG